MPDKILSKSLKKPINEMVRENIGKRLQGLKKEYPDWKFVCLWNKAGDKLSIKMKNFNLHWQFIFTKNKAEVFVEAPFYLRPFLEPFRKTCLKILDEELDKLC